MYKRQVQDYQDFFKALEHASPVPIGFEDIEGGALGYLHLLDNRIALQEGMSQLQTIKTAIHEIAHAKLHAKMCIRDSFCIAPFTKFSCTVFTKRASVSGE